MKKKSISTLDKIIGIAALTFFGYIVFLAVSEEGWKAGLLVIGKILGMALASTFVLMIVVGLATWAILAYKRNQRCKAIEREVFSQSVLEHPNKKKGIDMSCPGPNKFAR
jgi:hypothetical protein